MDTLIFEDPRQIWQQSCKNSKLAYFHLFQISKVQIFIQGLAWKWLNGLRWYFYNLFHISWKMGLFKYEHHTIRRSTLNLTAKSWNTQNMPNFNYLYKQRANFHTRPGWKVVVWFALIFLESISYTLKGWAFENGHYMIRGSTSNLTSKSYDTYRLSQIISQVVWLRSICNSLIYLILRRCLNFLRILDDRYLLSFNFIFSKNLEIYRKSMIRAHLVEVLSICI